MSEAPTRKPKPKPKRLITQTDQPIPTLTILAHPNPVRIGERVVLMDLAQGRPALVSRREPGFYHPSGGPLAGLNDAYISRAPLLFQPKGEHHVLLDQAQSGTEVSINGNPLRGTHVFSLAELEQGVGLVLAERILLWFHLSAKRPKPHDDLMGLIGFSDAIMKLREDIHRIRDLDTPILLRGASGSGKELVAQAIHQSGGKDRPWVSVNMSAIPPSLAAAELFGAQKGSFTGSSRAQTGFFRAAHGGTLFLDEIGETPLDVQAMLLRALETGEIQSVGSQTSQKVKVRLIAATDADLEAKMHAKLFREPLFHRLSGYVIQLPLLRQRRDDLGRLFMHFAKANLQEMRSLHHLQDPGPDADPWLPPRLMETLARFDWPGNVRQLRNAVRQMLIAARGLKQLHLPEAMTYLTQPPKQTPDSETPPTTLKPKNISADLLIETLQHHQWDIKAAALNLGISRGSIYALIEKTPGLQKASELTAETILETLALHQQDFKATANALRVSHRALRRRAFDLSLDLSKHA